MPKPNIYLPPDVLYALQRLLERLPATSSDVLMEGVEIYELLYPAAKAMGVTPLSLVERIVRCADDA